MEDSSEENWTDVPDDIEDKNKMHALRWDVYKKEK